MHLKAEGAAAVHQHLINAVVEISELSVVERSSKEGYWAGWSAAAAGDGHPLEARCSPPLAAAALLAGLRAHQQPHIGLNGADQGLQMLAFALKTGLLAQVEVPAGEDVELLLRLPSAGVAVTSGRPVSSRRQLDCS